MYGASGYTGQCGICAVCGRTDHCRRGRKGSVPITDGAIYNKEWNKKVIKNGIIRKRLQEFKQYRKTEDYTEKALKIKAFS